jgi:hypothetical protein
LVFPAHRQARPLDQKRVVVFLAFSCVIFISAVNNRFFGVPAINVPW